MFVYALCTLLIAASADDDAAERATDEALGADVEARAKALFKVGGHAYEAGQYEVAIRAFEGAYSAARRPEIVFSLAQSHRLQFFADGDTRKLERAVALYREYPISIAGGWGSCKLADVVEFEAAADAFLGGTSGSGLVSKGAAKLALSIQSLCIDKGPTGGNFNRRGIGTAFIRAVRWIREASGRDVELFWRVPPP